MRLPPSYCFAFVLSVFVLNPCGAQTDSARLSESIHALEDAMFGVYPVGLGKARAIHEEVLKLNCTTCKARSHRLLGRFYWVNGEYQKGLGYFRRAIVLAEAAGDRKTVANVLDLIGNTHYYQAYYDSALFYFNRALQVYEGEKDIQGMIVVNHDISLMFHRQGNFTKTIEYLFREEALKDQLPNSRYSIEAMGAMGSLMIDSLYYREEIADGLKSLRAFTQTGSRRDVFQTYSNLGNAYRQLEDYVQAARYFVKASLVSKEVGILPPWDQAGIDYRDAGMKDSAFYYHYLAKANVPFTNQCNATYILELIGDAHKFFKNPDSARFYYDSALRWNYRLNNRITFTGIHVSLVNINTTLGKFEAAERHLNTAQGLVKEVALIHEMNLYREAKRLYEKMGDYKRALFFSEQYRILRDSIQRSETALNLTKMQAEFRTAKKVREVDELQQKGQLHEAEMKTNRLQLALTGVLLLAAAGVGGLYFMRFRQKQRLSAHLEKSNKEKEVLLHEIHHRVKNNLQIISSLINLKSRQVSEDDKQVLQQINGRIFSMGLIHEKLYQHEDLRFIRLDEYLTEVGSYLLESFKSIDRPIHFRPECEPVEIDVDAALTCCLITNEIITNSVKHAFTDHSRQPEVSLAVRRINNQVVIRLADNGGGNGHGDLKKSFGLRFVDQLVSGKLNGEWSVQTAKGFEVNITFPWKK